jgi:hypothetical protein
MLGDRTMDNHDGTYTEVRLIEQAPYPPVVEITISSKEDDSVPDIMRSFEMTKDGINEIT